MEPSRRKLYLEPNSDLCVPKRTARRFQPEDVSCDLDEERVNDCHDRPIEPPVANEPPCIASSSMTTDTQACSPVSQSNTGGYDLEDLFQDNDVVTNHPEEPLDLQDEFLAPDDDEEDVETPPPRDKPFMPHALLEALSDKKFSEVSNLSSSMSPRDILYITLSLKKQFNLNVSIHLAILRMLNVIFDCNILPHSRPQLEKLLSIPDIMESHFYCKECGYYFGIVDRSEVTVLYCEECPSRTGNDIADLCRATFFITISIENQLRDLICSNFRELIDPRNYTRQSQVLKDLYDGEIYRDFASRVTNISTSESDKFVSLCAHTDGSPLFASSGVAIWPAFYMFCEAPMYVRMKKLIIGGFWCGSSKPKMDLFLKPQALAIRNLSREGFNVHFEQKNYCFRAFLLGVCVDSGARGSVQGLQSHSGYYSCNWCLIKGVSYDGVRFPPTNPAPESRTPDQMKVDMQSVLDNPALVHVHGVNGVCPYVVCPGFNNVIGFILDYLHQAALGEAKAKSKAWITDKIVLPNNKVSYAPYYIGGRLEEINSRLPRIKPPTQLKRTPRNLGEAFWKGKEWENWALHYSIVVLFQILPNRYLYHWAQFVQGLYLLLQENIHLDDLKLASDLLDKYYHEVSEFYSISHCTFNTHLTSHLSENVRCWGPLWCVCGYSFEAATGEVKRVIHANRGIMYQVCKNLAENKILDQLKCEVSEAATNFVSSLCGNFTQKSLKVGDVRAFGNMKSWHPTQEEANLCEINGHDPNRCSWFDRLVVRELVLSCGEKATRDRNSYVLLENGDAVHLCVFLYDEAKGHMFALGNIVHCQILNVLKPMQLPLNKSCVREVIRVREEKMYIDLSKIVNVCVYMNMPNIQAISPVPYRFAID